VNGLDTTARQVVSTVSTVSYIYKSSANLNTNRLNEGPSLCFRVAGWLSDREREKQ